jgi:small subunit ribosomal protein S4e
VKIVGKQNVAGGDVQLQFHDGSNIRVGDASEYDTKDSLVLDNETRDVVAHFPYEEGALVTAVDGEHAGEIGTVDEIVVTKSSGPNIVRVAQDEGGFETVENYVVVIDENFTGDDGEDGGDDE